MAGDLDLREFRRKLQRLGCDFRWTGRGYLMASRSVHGRSHCYPIPTRKGRKVKAKYVKLVRTNLHITPQEWDNA